MKNFYVEDALKQDGQLVTSFFVVVSKQVRSRKNGEPYIALTLADKTGRIEAKIWENFRELVTAFEQDNFVKVRGRVTRYNGHHEITVEKIRRAEDSEVEPADYLPCTKQDVEALWTELNQMADSIKHQPLRSLIRAFLTDPVIAAGLRRAPAAQIMHHAYIGGLLEHVVSLCRLCDLAVRNYVWIDRDLLMAGAILHDIGKIEELSYDRSIGYTDRGELVGHISIATELLHSKRGLVPDLPQRTVVLLEHLILSHHGERAYGSPVEPRCAEALVLHYLDQIDSKLQAVWEGINTGQGTPWTQRSPMLKRRMLDAARFVGLAPSGSPRLHL